MVASDARRASRARQTRGALRCDLATVLLMYDNKADIPVIGAEQCMVAVICILDLVWIIFRRKGCMFIFMSLDLLKEGCVILRANFAQHTDRPS